VALGEQSHGSAGSSDFEPYVAQEAIRSRRRREDFMSKGALRESPLVTEMSVIPVAGHDSMLLNLSGAHGPFFTRNIVILKDNAGNTGVGEVPGGAPASVRRWRTRGRWSSVARSVCTTMF
jgi:hypothetical protein